MESEPWCEAPPVVTSARSVLLYVRTHRSERWRIAPRSRLQATLFQVRKRLGVVPVQRLKARVKLLSSE
jgi:hypothetical protein